ncbi:hypothetical protein GWK47_003872 [Chionoecetes opilio]|uniref:Uncharacterized protein n=1 Tax=Chionoecetes opilio TaxID=41210 RepID=A0A8J4YXN1_CHIOP|nr:hypothetical protein GWK47_003872 [Chionoecetes opilio]
MSEKGSGSDALDVIFSIKATNLKLPLQVQRQGQGKGTAGTEAGTRGSGAAYLCPTPRQLTQCATDLRTALLASEARTMMAFGVWICVQAWSWCLASVLLAAAAASSLPGSPRGHPSPSPPPPPSWFGRLHTLTFLLDCRLFLYS